MLIQRTNPTTRRPAAATADDCFAAMDRHNAPRPLSSAPLPIPVPAPPSGDILYGGLSIARYLFPDETPKRARRRVFHLWAHYSARKERAGFFKLKGALCLSKSQWLAFHGLA